MIRPNFRLAAGALFLCIGANVSAEPGRRATGAQNTPLVQSQQKVPTKAVLPDPNRKTGGTELTPLRPEAVTSLIPVKQSEGKPKSSERKPEIVALPALPPVNVPLHAEPIVPEKPKIEPAQRVAERPATPPTPKREVPPLVSDSPTASPKPKVPTRVGKTLLRDGEEEPPVSVPVPEPVSPRKPTAIDPKEMAPISGGSVKMPALAIRSGVSDNPTSPLQDFNAGYIRKLAIEAGVNEALATEVGNIIEQKRAGNPVALSKAARSHSDAWLVRSCEELKNTAEAERPVAFQEMLRVHKRMRATEPPAAK